MTSLSLATLVKEYSSGEVATAQTDLADAAHANVDLCFEKMGLAAAAAAAAVTAAATALDKKGDASDAAADAHVAQIARNLTDATAAAALALTASNQAKTASDGAKEHYENAWAKYILAAVTAGVACKELDGTEHKTDGDVYIDPDGKRVPGPNDTQGGFASSRAAVYYKGKLSALDSLKIAIGNYNSALAVPASDPDKKSSLEMTAMRAAIDLLVTDYDAKNLLALASAANAKDCATHAAAAKVSAEAAKTSADAAKADSDAALAYKVAADNDVTNSAVKSITLNFNVEIDADSSLTVFGDKPLIPENVIVASYKLPVDSLYDNANQKGLIEFWEPSDAQGDIRVELARTDFSSDESGANSYKESAVKLSNNIESILCAPFNCVGCKPFNDSKYANKTEYTEQRDFGRVALATLAHFLFGHVDATSAITNDVSFIKSMLSIDSNIAATDEGLAGPKARYDAYLHLMDDTLEVDEMYKFIGNANDARLAQRLVGAILKKGMYRDSEDVVQFKSSNVVANSNDPSCLANIVRQVIGQDQTRAMNQDNSQRTLDEHVLLRFYPGDTVYMNIKLKKPTIYFSPGASAGLSSDSLSASYSSEISFTLKMELD